MKNLLRIESCDTNRAIFQIFNAYIRLEIHGNSRKYFTQHFQKISKSAILTPNINRNFNSKIIVRFNRAIHSQETKFQKLKLLNEFEFP